MYKIKNIKKCGESKYQIEFTDNSKIKIYDNVLLKNNILFKKELNDELYNSILKENTKEDNYYQVVKFISKKMRSKKEVIDFIDKLDYDYKEKEEVLKRLISNHLINDKMYARAYVQDKFYLTSDGPIKIRENLVYNNIDNFIIEELLNELDENEIYSKLEKLINKKIKSNTTKSSYALKQKIIYDMKNLGYDISMINEILDNSNISSNGNVISKEYSRLYRKLSNKYEGEELSRQIYYKLRSKGFIDEEITNIKI